MSEKVAFKANKQDPAFGSPNEVRRFQLDKDVSTSFTYLHNKITTNVFPELTRKAINITWVDNDGDVVTIASDEDLIIALTEMEGPVYKVNVVVKEGGAEASNGGGEETAGKLHPGVTCDGCHGQVHGFRYKCTVCPDYDLCASCEGRGVHGEHNMLRMVKPMPGAGVWPHHFFKKFQRMQERADKKDEGCFTQGLEDGRPGCGGPMRGRGGCHRGRGGPFRGRGGFAPPPPPHLNHPFASFFGGWLPGGHPSGPPPPPQQDQAAEAISNNASEQAAQFLGDIGQLVAAALDPFGIDVDVSVEPKNKPMSTASESTSDEQEKVEVPINKEAAKDDAMEQQQGEENPPEPEKKKSMDCDLTTNDNEEGWTDVKVASPQETPNATSGDQPVPQSSTQGAKATAGPSGVAQQQRPDTEDQEMVDPRIQVAVQAMMNMGFTNEGGWLTTLLEAKQGDIGKVLDLLQPPVMKNAKA